MSIRKLIDKSVIMTILVYLCSFHAMEKNIVRVYFYQNMNSDLFEERMLVITPRSSEFEKNQGLRQVAADGDLNAVKKPIDFGADFSNGMTFRNALFNGHLSIIKYLTERGAFHPSALGSRSCSSCYNL